MCGLIGEFGKIHSSKTEFNSLLKNLQDNKNILSSKLEENIFELEEKLESLKKNNMEQIYQIEKILEENIKLRDKLKSVEALAKKNNKPFNEVENEIYFVFQIFKYKFLNDKT